MFKDINDRALRWRDDLRVFLKMPRSINGKTVLVVGGGGFIGSNVARKFSSAGFDVRVAGRSLQPLHPIGDSKYFQIDLLGARPDLGIFDDVQIIIHSATTTIPSTSMRDMAYDHNSNCSIALRLLEIAAARNIETFLFISSGGTVYGIPKRLPVREDHPTDPISSYGITKLSIEKYVHLYGLDSIARAVSLRVANPYGQEQLMGTPVGALANFTLRALMDEKIHIWGNGSIVRDYIDVSDLANAVLAAVAIPSGAYNIGSGQGHSLNDLIEIVAKFKGRALDVTYESSRSIDVPNIVLDTSKFAAAANWSAEISLIEGAKKLWDFAQRQHLRNRAKIVPGRRKT